MELSHPSCPVHRRTSLRSERSERDFFGLEVFRSRYENSHQRFYLNVILRGLSEFYPKYFICIFHLYFHLVFRQQVTLCSFVGSLCDSDGQSTYSTRHIFFAPGPFEFSRILHVTH